MPAGLTLGTVAGACALGAAGFGVSFATAGEDDPAAPRSETRLGTPAATLDLELPKSERVALGRAVRLPAIAPPQRPPEPAPVVTAPPPEEAEEPPAPEPVEPVVPVPVPAPVPTPAPAPTPPPAPAPDPPPVDFDDSG